MSSSAGHGVALSRTKVCEGKESFENTEGTRLVRPRAKTNEVNKIKRNLEKRYICTKINKENERTNPNNAVTKVY